MAAHNATVDISFVTKVVGAAAVASFAKSVVGAASDAEQALGGVEAVFKENAGAVKSWAADSAAAIGLSKTDYETLATTIGSQLKNAGTSMSELAPKTDSLIKMGADLAAQYGGSTSDAVEALSSLLKGERDPIEKYGVSITAAAVAAKKAELGLTGLSGAADTAATQQATLALLTAQTTDALGANAREADTTAGKQARLTAAWKDAQVTMGTALLPAFNSLLGAAQDLLPAFLPLVTAAADFAATVAKLPAPLLAAAAGLAAFLKYGGNIGGVLRGMRAGTTSAAAGFKALGKSLAIGGAVGLAAAALTTIVGAFENASRHAQEMRDRTTELGDELVRTGGKWTATATQMQKDQFRMSNGWKLAQQAGISFGDAFDLATGKMENQIEVARLLGKADDYINNWDRITHSDAAAGLEELNGGLADQVPLAHMAAAETLAYNINTKGMAAINATAGKTIEQIIAGYAGITVAAPKSAEEMKKEADAAAKAHDAHNKLVIATAETAAEQASAAAESTKLAAALDAAASAADDTKRAAQGLNLVLDKLTGRNRTAEQTAADLNKSLTDLGDAFSHAKDEAGVNKQALLAWNVPALTTTGIGQKVFDSLNDVRDAYAASTAKAFTATSATKGVSAAMDAARKAADSARAKFIANHDAMGLTAEQAQKLADKLGILEGKKLTDKEFKLIADDQAAQKLKDLEAKRLKDKKLKVQVEDSQAKDDLNQLSQDRSMSIFAHVIPVAAGFQGQRPGNASTPFLAPPGVGVQSLDAAATPFTAPSVPIKVRVAVPAAATVVNVYGALDPVAVARQVSTLLTGQQRRGGGGPRIGGRA